MDIKKKKTPGYYWVKYKKSKWVIAYVDENECFWIDGDDFIESYFECVDEKQIKRKLRKIKK